MNPDDTDVSHALQQLATAGHPPVNQIRSRARILRRRRHGAAAAVAVLAAAAIATPVVGAVGDQDAKPGFADTSAATRDTQDPEAKSECTNASDDPRTVLPLTAEEVPDDVRLMWSPLAAEAPTGARAEDPFGNLRRFYPTPCSPNEDTDFRNASIYDMEDDVITRAINVFMWRDGPAANAQAPNQSFVLDVDGTDVYVFRPDLPDEPAGAEQPELQLQVHWNDSAGAMWRIMSTRDVTDEEIRDLVESVELSFGDSRIGFGESSVARAAALVITQNMDDDEPTPGYVSYEATGPRLNLEVHEFYGESDIMLMAEVGDIHLANGINGQPTQVSIHPRESSVSWEPVPGEVTASLRGEGYSADELLEIAQSIEPVPADDERLTDVWGTCPADEYSSSLITPCDE